MIIEHISISRNQLWEQCEVAYKYKYHEKIPVAEEPVYFLYGKIVHKIIEEYTRARGQTDINVLAKDIITGKIELDGSTEKASNLSYDYRTKLPGHLRSFMKLTEQIGVDGDVEWKFEYDLKPPEKKLLTGVIDRCIRKGNKFFVIDYKTTKKGPWRKNRDTIKTDLQLQCYSKVVQRTFGAKAEDIKCALYFLEGAELLPVQFSQSVLDTVDSRLLQVYEEIEGRHPDFARANVGPHCQRCDYKKICPYFRAKNGNYDMDVERFIK